VTIVLRHNERLELNLVEYRDTISLAQLQELAAYAVGKPEHMRRDSLNLVRRRARFADVDEAALDELFAHYRQLYAPLNFQMLRRSAWICFSEAAAPQVRHWLTHDSRQAMSSAVRRFDTYADAGEWLVLNTEEIAIVERGEGFAEIARFGAAPAPAR
jgi:hypothetical protein